MLASFTAPDFQEGVASFLERRDPRFARSAREAAGRRRGAQAAGAAPGGASRRAAQPHAAATSTSARPGKLRGDLARRSRRSLRALRRCACSKRDLARRRAPAAAARRAARRAPRAPRAQRAATRPRVVDRDGDPGQRARRAARAIRPVHSGPPHRQPPYGSERSSETIAPRMSAGCRCVPEMSGRSICHTTRTPELLARARARRRGPRCRRSPCSRRRRRCARAAGRPPCRRASARRSRGSSRRSRTRRSRARTARRRGRGTARPGRAARAAARRSRLEIGRDEHRLAQPHHERPSGHARRLPRARRGDNHGIAGEIRTRRRTQPRGGAPRSRALATSADWLAPARQPVARRPRASS